MSKATKQALLDSAEHAARSRGWDGFSYADLAKEVGIRKASIHYHFPAKSDLSLALLERYAADMHQACRDIDAAHETGGKRLRAMIHHYRKALNHGETVCLCVSLSTSRESLPTEVMTHIAAFRNMMVAWLSASFELGSGDASISDVNHPLQEATASLALLEGAHLAAHAELNVAKFNSAVEYIEQRCH